MMMANDLKTSHIQTNVGALDDKRQEDKDLSQLNSTGKKMQLKLKQKQESKPDRDQGTQTQET